MRQVTARLVGGALGALLLCAVSAAAAQESGGGNAVIGPPQLKDFSLQPRERLVEQPAPPPAQARPAETRPPDAEPASQSAEVRRRADSTSAPTPSTAREETAAAAETPPPAPAAAEPAPAPAPVAAAEPVAPVPVPALADSPLTEARESTPIWYFALPAAALAFLGVALVRRRRRAAPAAEAPAAAAAETPPPPRPRPDPVPRPWLELSLKAERAAFTATEAELLFELEIANKGGSPARNLRIDVKMFNAGAEQDQEIGAFFKTAGRESTKCHLTIVEAGVVGVIKGSVGMPLEEMRAMRLDERLLFIPVVAVNALYDWGEGRTGQTSRSYLVGREASAPGEKMGAFRVDQGPRVWRSVGQREHKLAKRV